MFTTGPTFFAASGPPGQIVPGSVGAAGFNGENLYVFRISSTEFVLGYSASGSRIRKGTVSGNTVTFGPPASTGGRCLIEGTYVAGLDSSGGTQLTVSTVDLATMSFVSTFTLVTGGAPGVAQLCALDSTTLLVMWSNAGTPYARVLNSAAGVLSAAGPDQSLASILGQPLRAASSSNAVLASTGRAYNISGGTVTLGGTVYAPPNSTIIVADMLGGLGAHFYETGGVLKAFRAATSGTVTTYSSVEDQTSAASFNGMVVSRAWDGGIIRVARNPSDGYKMFAQLHGFAGTINSLGPEVQVTTTLANYNTVVGLSNTTAVALWAAASPFPVSYSVLSFTG